MRTKPLKDKPSRPHGWAAAALLLLLPATASAAPLVPPQTQAKNLVRVLTYDRNFNTRYADGM